ncbi:MAG: hypothetical protein QME51_09825, partial [Planctomycetota bacterium]|nr:hypothetical protein [Planctomycetota bacterium]
MWKRVIGMGNGSEASEGQNHKGIFGVGMGCPPDRVSSRAGLIAKLAIIFAIGLMLYAADDVKIKLTDPKATGGSEFAVQDSNGVTVFRVSSAGNTKLLNNAELRLYNSVDTFYAGFKAAAGLGANRIWTLPTVPGTAGQSLVTTDAAGTLGFADREPAFTTLGISKGGTNSSSLTQDKFLYYNGTSIVASAYYNTDFEPANANIQAHISSTSNPHSVTKSQVGLGSVTDALQLVASSNLSDLPNTATARSSLLPSYTGNANKFLRVNAGATEVEWATAGVGDMLKSVYDPNDDGIIGIAQGGTNSSSLTQNKFLYFNGTSIIASAYYNTDFEPANANIQA